MLNEMEMKQAAEQQNSAPTKKKPWPKNCPWPEPTAYSFDYDEDTAWSERDDETRKLLKVKEYFDSCQ